MSAGVTIIETSVLTFAAFCTSALTAVMGLGGGIALLAIMAQVLPFVDLIAVHGTIQLGSNLSRAAVMRQEIHWKMVMAFCAGALIGTAMGAPLIPLVTSHGSWIMIGLGVFILMLIWVPPPRGARLPRGPITLGAVGAGVSFLSLSAGATGPLLAPFMARPEMKPLAIVGTMAACQSFQHALKVAAYMAMGFVFSNYLVLIAAMLVASALGSLAGARLLGKIPEKRFRFAFKLLLTALAIRMIGKELL